MSTQARKLEIIERVLHLDSEELLGMLEQVLEMLQTDIPGEEDIPSMLPRSRQEIADRLTESLADVQAGRTITSDELRVRATRWQSA